MIKPGLKGHITKMHSALVKCKTSLIKNGPKKEQEANSDAKSEQIHEEANKVVDKLLSDVATDEEEMSIEEIDLVILDETCEEIDEKNLKHYHNKCENCDYVAEATRRYVALQFLSKHKQSCKDNCTKTM